MRYKVLLFVILYPPIKGHLASSYCYQTKLILLVIELNVIYIITGRLIFSELSLLSTVLIILQRAIIQGNCPIFEQPAHILEMRRTTARCSNNLSVCTNIIRTFT